MRERRGDEAARARSGSFGPAAFGGPHLFGDSRDSIASNGASCLASSFLGVKGSIMSAVVLAIKVRAYREALADALVAREGLDIAEAVPDAAGALQAMQSRRPAVVLVEADIEGALELPSVARTMNPPIAVIALSLGAGAGTGDADAELLRWAEAGAAGFVNIEHSLDELLVSLRAAQRGELVCSSRVSAAILRRVGELAAQQGQPSAALSLTSRQAQILHCLGAGYSNKQIARELGIELATVKNHVHGLLKRLQVRDRREAAAAVARLSSPRRLDKSRD
jgi:DNA-binding NarL/FixJ family response regulator